MYDKICDKTKEHSRNDHWNASYGFRKQGFGSSFNQQMPGRNEIRCLDYQKGHCNYGSTCRFSHGNGYGNRQFSITRRDSSRNHNVNICRDWQNGRCRRGNQCRFNHGGNNGQVQVCFDWQKGRCTRGDRCKFNHPPVDAQKTNIISNDDCWKSDVNIDPNLGVKDDKVIHHSDELVRSKDQVEGSGETSGHGGYLSVYE